MLLFEINGPPIPQKQTRFAKGRAYDPSKREKECIQWQLRPFAPANPFTCPLSIDITFYLPIPMSESSVRKRQMANNIIKHIKKPDIDNLAYIVTNACKKIIYEDDAQIVDMSLHKRYGEKPRTVIKIIPIELYPNAPIV